MPTPNKPMTSEQLDELMTVAVNMQRDSESNNDRQTSLFAYAVQVAVLELRQVRELKPVDENHVAAMNSIKAIISILGSSDTLGISEQVAELKAQRDALAAENAGLKAAFDTEEIPEEAVEAFTETAVMGHDWNDTGEYSWVENDTDVIRAVLEAIKPETPDTDSFLSELQAQGVEMMVEQCESDMMLIEPEDEEHYTLMIEHVKEFAAQLRQGGAV